MAKMTKSDLEKLKVIQSLENKIVGIEKGEGDSYWITISLLDGVIQFEVRIFFDDSSYSSGDYWLGEDDSPYEFDGLNVSVPTKSYRSLRSSYRSMLRRRY